MRLPALLLIATLSSGCSLLALSASHNGRGKPVCDSGPIPPTVDLVLASGMVALIATQDSHPGYFALPAVFVASGVIGGIRAVRCAAHHQPKPEDSPPLTNSAPSFGTVDPDPEARPATPEDLGVAPHPANLTLDPTYNVGPNTPPTTTPPPKTDERITCRDAPGSCPKGQTCAIAGNDAGFCVPDH